MGLLKLLGMTAEEIARLAPKYLPNAPVGEPAKVAKGYKLFRTNESGDLFPLFVDANTPVPRGQWIDAKMGEGFTFQGKNGNWYVPSTKFTRVDERTGKKVTRATGDAIQIPNDDVRQKLIELGYLPEGSKAKTVTALARRGGWHAGDAPMSTHIGGKSQPGLSGPDYRPDDQVWAEISMPDDYDWQMEALRRADRNKAGGIIPKTAHITDTIPYGGHYRYKTNPNMTGDWMIGGAMKVDRVLPDEEVRAINEYLGIKDLPRLRRGLLED